MTQIIDAMGIQRRKGTLRQKKLKTKETSRDTEMTKDTKTKTRNKRGLNC